MKRLLFLSFLIASFGVYAQHGLMGAWKATCPVEYKSRTAIKHCDLCPVVVDSSKKHATIHDFDFIVDQGFVTLTKENSSHIMIPYTWNDEKHVFSFSFNEKKYSFTVHYDDENIILLNDDGTMVLLKKKKFEIVR